jgi:hypothetical protein
MTDNQFTPRFSWTQPICESCFKLRYPHKGPVRLTDPDAEVCVDCQRPTTTGIYIRIDPAEAHFPSMTKD